MDDDLWDEEDCIPPAYNVGSKPVSFDICKSYENCDREDATYSNNNSFQNYRSSNVKQQTSYRNNSYNSENKRSRNSGENETSHFNRRRPNDSNDDTSEMLVDNSFVGKIIGRAGSKIQELQRESGAYIKVMKAESCSPDTVIRLSGSSEARDKAKKMIEDFIYGDRNASVSSYASSKPKEPEPEFFDWEKLRIQSEETKRKWLESLPPIVKDFYIENPSVAAMTRREVDAFRSENNSISVMKVDSSDDREIPNPVTSFNQAFQHYPELLEELRKQGFSNPSPIQCQAWPIIMKGYDLIGIAQTGTGKTIAFLFPALIHLVGQVTPREERVGPSVLILAPTRELAQQIEVEAKKYTYRGIKSICIYGGGNRREQINNVSRGVDIVIATPGRLNDLVMNEVVNVTGVTYLVLDEADRMLDLGFEPQIRKIVLDIRPDRQTLMTSATWTNEIQELAARYMTKPMKVNVGALDLAAVHTVTQEIIFGDDDYDERRKLLAEFLSSMGSDDKAIVFVERKSIADDISSDLILSGIEVQSIHGDREQYDREQALDDLKTGLVKILIATDVASRGLDIKDITLIFNLYFPHNIEEYVHRVGRTGRAGRTGKAISLFTRKDWMHAEGLIKILKEADQYVPEELFEMADRYRAWKAKKMAEDRAVGRRGGRRRY